MRTRNDACTLSPEVRPVAVTACVPGVAEAGTVTETAANAPEPSVVASPTCVASKRMSTISPLANPAPLTWTTVVGGPTCTERVTLGPEAGATGVATATRSNATATANHNLAKLCTHPPPRE